MSSNEHSDVSVDPTELVSLLAVASVLQDSEVLEVGCSFVIIVKSIFFYYKVRVGSQKTKLKTRVGYDQREDTSNNEKIKDSQNLCF